MKLYPEYGHEQIPYTNDTVFSFFAKIVIDTFAVTEKGDKFWLTEVKKIA